jgi:hypothetical protein
VNRVFINDVKNIAAASREELWANAKSAWLDCPKLVMHWTAGWGESLFDEYHFSVTTDGKIYTPVDSIVEHLNHTWKLNTGTVGVAMCCCVGATTNDLGEEPPTESQIEVFSQVIAAIADGIWVSITPENVLTHGEAADSLALYDACDLYGPRNTCERWDLEFLGTQDSPSFNPWASDGSRGGDVLRGKAIWYHDYWAKNASKA